MAAPTKTKTASTKDSQTKKPKSATNGHGTPTSTETTTTTIPLASTITLIEYGAGRPDKASYDKEQETIKAGIDALQVKFVRVAFVLSFQFVPGFQFESHSSVHSYAYGRCYVVVVYTIRCLCSGVSAHTTSS